MRVSEARNSRFIIITKSLIVTLAALVFVIVAATIIAAPLAVLTAGVIAELIHPVVLETDDLGLGIMAVSVMAVVFICYFIIFSVAIGFWVTKWFDRYRFNKAHH